MRRTCAAFVFTLLAGWCWGAACIPQPPAAGQSELIHALRAEIAERNIGESK